jgi:hypothetical protein
MDLGVKLKLRDVFLDPYGDISLWKILIRVKHKVESWPQIRLFVGMYLPVIHLQKVVFLLSFSMPGFLFPKHPPWSHVLNQGPFKVPSSPKCRTLCLFDDWCKLTIRNQLFLSCLLKLVNFMVLCHGGWCFGSEGSLALPLPVSWCLTPDSHWIYHVFLTFHRVILVESTIVWDRSKSYPKSIQII